MTYTANWNWDLALYMTDARLNIYHGTQRTPVASATYHLRNKGGLSLAKYGSAEAKMNQLIDQLLIQYQSNR